MSRKIKTLNFTREYKEKLLSGEKTSTLRLRTTLKTGDLVNVVAGGEKLGVARILSVKRVTLKDLTEKEVRRDGFKNKEALLKALRRHYSSNITPRSPLYLITFVMEPGS